jgi:hypothetical protein
LASRFWVGGTGTWDASDTTHWASSSGGAGGASVPGTGDTVTLNSSSGGGTVTVNTTVAVTSITMDSFAGTVDFATNNNNVTLSGNNVLAFSAAGSATQTLNMGDGTWTISGTTSSAVVVFSTAGSGLTLNTNSSTVDFTGTGGAARRIQFGSKTFNNWTFTGAGYYEMQSASSPVVGTMTLGAGANFSVVAGTTFTITTIASTASLSAPASLMSGTSGSQATIGGNGTYTFDNVAIRNLAFSGGNSRSATDSFDLGGNSGITITGPTGGGAAAVARVIGA